MQEIKYIKFNNFYDYPTRAHETDVGADVFSPEDIILKPNSITKIGLGFGIELPEGTMACMFPKSGLTSKGILSTLPPIDPGYTGEAHVILYNFNDNYYTINKGDKLAQMIIMNVIIDKNIPAKTKAKRGDNGFGSTGK